MKTGLENKYIIKNQKQMSFGYTTGSCAAAAAKAAVICLLEGRMPMSVSIMTPKGIPLHLEVLYPVYTGEAAGCSIQKDSGDDPDVTNHVCIRATATKLAGTREIRIDGGTGVGRVTKPGLEQPVGKAAINSTPRKMIAQCVREVMDHNNYSEGIGIIISVEGGEELAKRTFNPKLGIEGGISILGTSGIVEPMSEAALIATIGVELKMKAAQGKHVVLASPGNYGSDYSQRTFRVKENEIIKCSNFIGDTIDLAVTTGFGGILFISHIGKFVKVAGGMMNTHSNHGDCRMELMAAAAVRAGADQFLAKKILDCATTDDGIRQLWETPYKKKTLQELGRQMDYYLKQRGNGRIKIGAVVFSNVYGELLRTEKADELLEEGLGGKNR